MKSPVIQQVLEQAVSLRSRHQRQGAVRYSFSGMMYLLAPHPKVEIKPYILIPTEIHPGHQADLKVQNVYDFQM